jgi:hypothetical protein
MLLFFISHTSGPFHASDLKQWADRDGHGQTVTDIEPIRELDHE